MSVKCNACGSPIDAHDINVRLDTALCRQCDTSMPYSSLVHSPTMSMYTAPPAGCHVEDLGNRWRAVASTRSWKALPTIGFAIIWNGFVCFFLFGMIFARGQGGGPPLFVVFFLSGHIAVGAWVAWNALLLCVGDVEVVIEGNTLTAGTGVGPLRLRRQRLLGEVRSVRTEPLAGRRNQFGYEHVILLHGPQPLKFASLLNDERRQFMQAVLATELAARQRAVSASGNGREK